MLKKWLGVQNPKNSKNQCGTDTNKFDLIEKQFNLISKASYVTRNHTAEMINPSVYTISFHSCRIAQYMIICVDPEKLSKELLQAALFHDVFEFKTGDVVGPAKQEFPALGIAIKDAEDHLNKDYGSLVPTLNKVEESILDYFDKFELLVYALEQQKLGNKTNRNKQMIKDLNEFLSKRTNQIGSFFKRDINPMALLTELA